MSNDRTKSKKKRQAPPPRPKRKKFADDRTPVVKKIDLVCKIISIILALCFFVNVRILTGGGGYDDTKIVPVFGIANSKVETDVMEPEIEARSVVFTKAQEDYEKGDVVQYFDGEYNPVRRVVDVSANKSTYTLKGDNESDSQTVEVKAEDVSGKVFMSSTFFYGFFKVYNTALGAALTVLLSFLLLMMSDILMFKKRRAELIAKREAKAKKEARKLKVKQGLENPEEIEAEENPIEKRRAEKQAKLDKERAEIAAEMKEIQKKMKAEEEELKRGKRGKK